MDMIASIVLHIELQAEKRKKLKEDRRTDERWFDNLEEAYYRNLMNGITMMHLMQNWYQISR